MVDVWFLHHQSTGGNAEFVGKLWITVLDRTSKKLLIIAL